MCVVGILEYALICAQLPDMTFYPLALTAAFLHAFVGWRLAPELLAPWGWVLWLGLTASAVLMPLGLLGHRVVRQPWADRLSWVGLLLMGLFSSLFVLTVLRDVLLLAVWATDALGLVLPKKEFAHAFIASHAFAGFGCYCLGVFIFPSTPAVVRVDVPIASLPVPLQGFTLMQISDIHVGPIIKQAFLQRIVAKVNTLGADAVAITGDLVDGRVDDFAGHVASLAWLRSRHGTYFVTGNH